MVLYYRNSYCTTSHQLYYSQNLASRRYKEVTDCTSIRPESDVMGPSPANKKVALPTKDEQLSLSNTDIILKSNLTRLQLNEILSSVRDDEEGNAKRRKVAAWVDQVVEALKGLRVDEDDVELSSAFLTKKGLHGFTQLPSGSEPVPPCAFKAPAAVHVIGSFLLGTATAPFLNCDVAMVMPASCFEAR